MLLCLNFVRTKRGHFVTVTSLDDDDELFIKKYPYFSDRIIFKVDMKVGEQQQQRDDEVAAIRKIGTKNNIKISPIEKE